MVSLEVINLLVEDVGPEGLADEHHSIQLILKPGHVPRHSFYQSLTYIVAHLLQSLDDLILTGSLPSLVTQWCVCVWGEGRGAIKVEVTLLFRPNLVGLWGSFFKVGHKLGV